MKGKAKHLVLIDLWQMVSNYPFVFNNFLTIC